MNKSIYNISLDLHNSIAPHVLPVKQGDTARELRVTLVEDGAPYAITSDCAISLIAFFPDETTGSVAMSKSEIPGVLTVTIPAAWTETVGEIECEIRVSSNNSGGQRLTSPRFSLVVEEALDLYRYKVYWDRGQTPTIKEVQYVNVKDANFSVKVGVSSATSATYGWILVPAEIVPETGVYIASTNGIPWTYVDEEEHTHGGETVLYKVYRTSNNITTSVSPLVIFKEK